MWIDLSDQLPDTHPNPDIYVCSVLEAISNASFHGRHVLYGSNRTLHWLGNQNLSEPAKAAVTRARGIGAERGALREFVRSKLIVEPYGAAATRDDEGHWHAPIQLLVGKALLSSELIAENLRDVEAFEWAAKHFQQINSLRGVEIALMPYNGGGAEILECFKRALAAREKFTCAVTDSDKDHPVATGGHISRHCALESENASWICSHVELPVREIENLLPFNFVQDSITSSAPDAHLVPPLLELVRIAERRPDALKYADFKQGTPGRLANGSENNVEKRAYWESVVRDCLVAARICQDQCQHNPCSCNVSPGIGPQVLQRFLDYCGSMSVAKQIERMKNSPHWDEWLSVGGLIFDWGMADPRYRA